MRKRGAIGRLTTLVAVPAFLFSAAGEANAVALQNATATLSQTSFGGNPVATSIDGSFANNNGWAIYEGVNGDGGNAPGMTNPQTAVFETVSNVNTADGPLLSFVFTHNFNVAAHTLGRFRLSATTDARADFADGLSSGGDVSANWFALPLTSAVATNGITLTPQGDGSILAGGTNAANSVYTITVANLVDGLTGFRLEVLADASFPDSGPGRAPNGNFVLTEFQVNAVPEPASLGLIAFAGIALLRRR